MKLEELNKRYNSLPKSLRVKVERRTSLCHSFLYNMVAKNNFRHAIEVGTFMGKNTIYLAAAVEEGGGEVSTINISLEEINIARELANKVGLSRSINFIHGDSLKVLPRILSVNNIDFGFIDGLHDYRHSFAEYNYIKDALTPGSAAIVIDDVSAVHNDGKHDGGVPRTATEVKAQIVSLCDTKVGIKLFGDAQIYGE